MGRYGLRLVAHQKSEIRIQRSDVRIFCLLFTIFCLLSSVFCLSSIAGPVRSKSRLVGTAPDLGRGTSNGAGDRTTQEAQASGRRRESPGWIGSKETAETHYNRGKRYYKRAKYDKAIEELEIALSLDSEHREAKSLLERAKARMRVAESFKRLKARREAIKGAERELRKGAGKGIRPVKLAKEEPSEVEREREKEIRESYNKGRAHYREKEYGKAIEQFQKVLALDPGHAGALRYLRRAQEKMERAVKVKARDQRKAERKARREEIKRRRAERKAIREAKAEVERKRREELRLAVQKAKEERERKRSGQEARAIREDVRAHFNEGKAHYLNGNYREAIEQFQKALELDPNYTRAANYLERSQKKVDEVKAEEISERKEVEVWARKEAERRAGEEARRKKEEEIKLTAKIAGEKEIKGEAEEKAREEEIKAYYLEGKRLFSEGRYQEAIERFERVIELEGNPRRVYTTSARRYIERARRKLEKAEAKALREKVKSHYRKGMALYRKNRYEGAIEEFQKALSLDPNYTRAVRYIEMARARIEVLKAKKLKVRVNN